MIEVKSLNKIEEIKNILGDDIYFRFIKNQNISYISKDNVKVCRIFMIDEPIYIIIDDKLTIYTDNEEVKKIHAKEIDEFLYTLFSLVTDRYMELLTNIENIIVEKRKEVLTEKRLDYEKLVIISAELAKIEKYIENLKEVVHITLKNPVYLSIINSDIQHLLTEIDDLHTEISSLVSLHISVLERELNENIGKLTMISVVFMPPTLVASVFNTEFMVIPPSFQGFILMLTMMALSSAITYFIFRKMFKKI